MKSWHLTALTVTSIALTACSPQTPTQSTASESKANHLSATTASTIQTPSTSTNPLPKMIVHKDANCGCCGEYADYLREHGAQVEVITQPNMSEIRQQFGTAQGASCHTVQVGNYVVEGHVPIAAIEKMIREQPNIKGIALPGMPMNSPGMGEEKKGSLNIMAIEHDGSVNRVFSVE